MKRKFRIWDVTCGQWACQFVLGPQIFKIFKSTRVWELKEKESIGPDVKMANVQALSGVNQYLAMFIIT